jgi:hypothetical protein
MMGSRDNDFGVEEDSMSECSYQVRYKERDIKENPPRGN